MKALCWYGTKDVRIDSVPDPGLVEPTDAIVRVTSTAICGSDLHLYNGYIPEMTRGDVLGHEFMGEVVDVGREVRNLAVGDRVVVPAVIACGLCEFCRRDEWSLCDNSNRGAATEKKYYGAVTAALFAYSGIYGAYAGGQAEYVRVPFADVGPLKIPDGLPDEKVLFLSDIFPTGYQAAEFCQIRPGATVAVWGCGPVGQFAILSAKLLGAGRVIAIDEIPERLALAQTQGAETIDFSKSEDVVEDLRQRTGGQGPDDCIDAVGMEARGSSVQKAAKRVTEAVGMASDHLIALRQAINACRKGGTVSIVGVYGGMADTLPMGVAFTKGLTFRMGQLHAQRYMRPLMERIVKGEVDPSFVISHRLPLQDAPRAYEIFDKKQDNCIKVVLKPG